MRAWAFIACLSTNLYLLGVMAMFAFVVYPEFGAVDRASFPALYASFNSRIGLPVVVWEFMALVTTLALYGWRPPSVSAAEVHVLVALGVLYFAITFGWHLPAHRPLAAGDNGPEALAPLLLSQGVRTAVQAVRCLLLAWLGARAMTA